jgi:hypothetical protein
MCARPGHRYRRTMLGGIGGGSIESALDFEILGID